MMRLGWAAWTSTPVKFETICLAAGLIKAGTTPATSLPHVRAEILVVDTAIRHLRVVQLTKNLGGGARRGEPPGARFPRRLQSGCGKLLNMHSCSADSEVHLPIEGKGGQTMATTAVPCQWRRKRRPFWRWKGSHWWGYALAFGRYSNSAESVSFFSQTQQTLENPLLILSRRRLRLHRRRLGDGGTSSVGLNAGGSGYSYPGIAPPTHHPMTGDSAIVDGFSSTARKPPISSRSRDAPC